MSISFPTSSDIYLEANGKKIAVIQSYKAVSSKKEKLIEAFGETEPIAALTGRTSYKITLSRLYATDEAITDGINFHNLSDFSLVIVKPDRRIAYTGCRWSNIEEEGALGETVAERITVIAAKRVETEA